MAVKAKAKRKKRKTKKLTKKNKLIIALCSVLVIAVAIGGFTYAFRGDEKVYYDFGKDTARGYDVSEHNGKIPKTKKSIQITLSGILFFLSGKGLEYSF